MRTAFIEALTELAAADSRIILIVGDLGFGVVTDFARRFPGQYINPGVAEQNMTGIAAGMALCGKICFTYSIANFPTLRPLEQIRNDVCYHNANVKIVSVGGGMAYGALGMSHFATEDLAILRALPNMVVVAPGDAYEARCATQAAARHEGPVYLRLGRAGEPDVHTGQPDFRLGEAIEVRQGADVALISTGGMLKNTVDAAAELARGGVEATVVSMHTVKPIDPKAVRDAAERTGAVVTIEEHSILGGLGGAVAEVLCEAGIPTARLHRLGLPGEFPKGVGGQEHMRRQYGLSTEGLVGAIQAVLSQ